MSKALGADAAAGDTDTPVASPQLSHDEMVAECGRYKRALENHLCPHDMADWLHCSFNHNDACAVCQHDGGGEHVWLVRAEKAEAARAWQPIETAPKDGTRVDLIIDGMREPDCWWGEPYEVLGDGPAVPQWVHWNDRFDCPSAVYTDPTHWMPIPALPIKVANG